MIEEYINRIRKHIIVSLMIISVLSLGLGVQSEAAIIRGGVNTSGNINTTAGNITAPNGDVVAGSGGNAVTLDGSTGNITTTGGTLTVGNFTMNGATNVMDLGSSFQMDDDNELMSIGNSFDVQISGADSTMFMGPNTQIALDALNEDITVSDAAGNNSASMGISAGEPTISLIGDDGGFGAAGDTSASLDAGSFPSLSLDNFATGASASLNTILGLSIDNGAGDSASLDGSNGLNITDFSGTFTATGSEVTLGNVTWDGDNDDITGLSTVETSTRVVTPELSIDATGTPDDTLDDGVLTTEVAPFNDQRVFFNNRALAFADAVNGSENVFQGVGVVTVGPANTDNNPVSLSIGGSTERILVETFVPHINFRLLDFTGGLTFSEAYYDSSTARSVVEDNVGTIDITLAGNSDADFEGMYYIWFDRSDFFDPRIMISAVSGGPVAGITTEVRFDLYGPN